MIPVAVFANRPVGVFGLGRSGLATVRALIAGGSDVFVWDDNTESAQAARSLGARVAAFEEWPWERLAALVLAPGVPLTHPKPHPIVVKAGLEKVQVIGDVDLFGRALRAVGSGAKIIAITGTNGKSTTTALTGHLLERCGYTVQVGGNIGKPVLELEPPTDQTAYVLELSSYQIDLTHTLDLDAGALLNITPDHLDRHGNLENYAAVKARLFDFLKPEGHAIIGVDDGLCQQICTRMSARMKDRVLPVSVGKILGRGFYVLDGVLYDGTVPQCLKVRSLRGLLGLPGAHNWQNAAVAYGLVRALGGDAARVEAAFESFPGLAHRAEYLGEVAGVRFINDSKATNAEAAAKALVCFDPIYWIAGGRAKGDGIDGLSPYLKRVRKAYLIGEAQEAFAETLKGRVPVEKCGDLETAVARASADALAKADDQPTVLFSPACASFDQYRNFEIRGDAFRSAVAALIDQSVIDASASSSSSASGRAGAGVAPDAKAATAKSAPAPEGDSNNTASGKSKKDLSPEKKAPTRRAPARKTRTRKNTTRGKKTSASTPAVTGSSKSGASGSPSVDQKSTNQKSAGAKASGPKPSGSKPSGEGPEPVGEQALTEIKSAGPKEMTA